MFHRADAERRRRITEPEHIRRQVHDDRTHGRMVRRHRGEKPDHQRLQRARDDDQQPGALRDLHQAEEQRHHADQTDRKRDGVAGGVDHRFAECRHRRIDVAALRRHKRHLPVCGNDEGDCDDGKEDAVQEGIP
jgi:hypothetical protein